MRATEQAQLEAAQAAGLYDPRASGSGGHYADCPVCAQQMKLLPLGWHCFALCADDEVAAALAPYVGSSNGAGGTDEDHDTDWLESATDLLREPDPGPTPWLVEDLIVDQAIGGIVGKHKARKTFIATELAISITTGKDAFGRYAIPKPGAVIFALEESGRDALHRRLDMVRRGYALDIEQLTLLSFSANRGVRLDDPVWQRRLLEAGRAIKPRAIFLDPLVRMKGAEREESSQKEMGPVLDFMRELREQAETSVVFVHHTGHEGTRMRGTSDLEAYWESKLTVALEDGKSTITAAHREAESGEQFRFRFDFDAHTRTLRLPALESPKSPSLREQLVSYLREHPRQTTEEVAKGVARRKDDVRSQLISLEGAGTSRRVPSQRTDQRGRTYSVEVWEPASKADVLPFRESGTSSDQRSSEGTDGPAFRPSLEAGPGTADPQDGLEETGT